MDPVDAARELIRTDLDRFQEVLTRALEPQREYLTETEYALYRRGKKLRPLMLLLAARLNAGQLPELPLKVIKASVSLEMLHVATLIHDDIVDVAPTRRGMVSVYADRGTEMAVLIGDMQFLQAIRCFAEDVETADDLRLVRLVLDVGFKICCGELDEIMTDPTWDLRRLEGRYFRTVDRKTAMLFGLACESGAALMGAGKTETFYMSRFGRRFGAAFQIMDDIFDLVKPADVSGKAQGIDIAMGRLSLPIIYAMERLPADHPLFRILRREEHSEAAVGEAIEAVAQSDGMVRAYSKARELMMDGQEFLLKFPPGAYREALMEISEFVINRSVLDRD